MTTVMTALRPSERDPELAGLRVLVIGLGRSGLAAARLAASRGASVLVADARSEAEIGDAVPLARRDRIEVRTGGHPASLADEADIVIVSPGVPPTVGPIAAARSRGLPVWGEVELGARFCRGRIIGITGSNGKSTTTAMLGAILRGAGIPGGTGGNLATPLCELLALDREDAIHAVELSSFQLETVEALRPAVAAILNLSPDHLDRYPDLDAYAAAKARLLEVQSPDAFAILNADDPSSARFERAARGRLHRFSVRGEVERGAFVRAGRIVLRTDAGEVETIEVSAIPVPGEHNLANAAAAALSAGLAGVGAGAIADGLRAFRALPHRLEHVATIDGVAFYNDSKATNPDSALRALRSFPPGSAHMILGGKDKGSDWGELLDEVRHRARRVLLVGSAAAMLEQRLDGSGVPLEACETVARAVEIGFAGAREGEVVLLSPGCASFDQYRNFEERGSDFRRAVAALAGREGRSA